MKSILFAGLVGLMAASGAAYAFPHLPGTFEGAKLVKDAPVSLAQAEAAALKARPGKIVKREAEKEDGGTGIRYSFDIKAADGAVYEVGIDSQTGAVLENGSEDAATEAKEAKEEHKD